MNPVQMQLQRVLAEAQELKRLELSMPYMPAWIRFKLARLVVIKPTHGVCYTLTKRDPAIAEMLAHVWYDGYNKNGDITTGAVCPINVESDLQQDAMKQFQEHAPAGTLWVGPQLDARIELVQRALRSVPKLVHVDKLLTNWAIGNTNAWKEIVYARTCLEQMSLRGRATALNASRCDTAAVLERFEVHPKLIEALTVIWEACELGSECYPICDRADSLTAPEQLQAYKDKLWMGFQGDLRRHLAARSTRVLQSWSSYRSDLLPKQPGEFIIEFNFGDHFNNLVTE